MIDWLDKHSNAAANLISIAFELERLADAFWDTGNKSMHKELSAIAKDIDQAAMDMRGAMAESITESINRSAESSKNLLTASLAGVMIAKKDI